MNISSFAKMLLKDFLISFVFTVILYLFLRYILYLPKNSIPYILTVVFLLLFVFSVSMSFFMYKLKIKIELLNNKIAKLSQFDEITDVYKRLYFFEMADKYYNVALRKKLPLSTMIIDIDGFKNYNKLYGHEYADKILKKIASVIKHELRGMDIVGRFGGDEFIIVSFSKKEELMNFAKRLNKKLSHIKVENKDIVVSTSIGISEMQFNEPFSDIIKRAEEAIILAKQKGGNRVDYLEHFLLFE